MFVSAHASQARFDVEECGSHPSVSLGRVVPASDLPSELAGHAVEGFDAVGGSEASFQEWEHTQPVEVSTDYGT